MGMGVHQSRHHDAAFGVNGFKGAWKCKSSAVWLHHEYPPVLYTHPAIFDDLKIRIYSNQNSIHDKRINLHELKPFTERLTADY